jgi:hypothetical protein
MTDRVMVDLETLGTEPGAAILSVGAVRFGPHGVADDEFERSVSLESCQAADLHIDADTLEWWLGQDDAVTDVLTGGDDLADVLADFAAYYGNADEIWAYSPSFDCAMLAAAYDAVGQDVPWHYSEERDARTLRNLPLWPEGIEREGAEHDALADARYQARCTGKALHRLGVSGNRAFESQADEIIRKEVGDMMPESRENLAKRLNDEFGGGDG